MGQKLSLRFYLDKRHVDAFNTASVHCKVRVSGVDVNPYSLGVRAFVGSWNAVKQRLDSSDMEAAHVNAEISRFELKVRQAFNYCMINDVDRYVDVRVLDSVIKGEESTITAITAVDSYLAEIEAKKIVLSDSAIAHYRILRNQLHAFVETKEGARYKITPISLIRQAFTKLFYAHLLGTGMKPQSAAVYMGKLSHIGEWLVSDRELLTKNYFISKGRGTAAKEKLSLSVEDWLRYARFDGSTLPGTQQFTYQATLLQAFTGLAYWDLAHLTISDIVTLHGRKWIVKKRSKNTVQGVEKGVSSFIPLLDEAESIMRWFREYRPHSILIVPHDIAYMTYLRHLDKICDAVGIQRLTTHDFRKIFTNYVCAEADNKSITAALGHASTTTAEKHYFNRNVEHIAAEFDKVQASLKKLAL